MAKFDFDKPVASFSWYLQNGSADDKRGNRLHVGTGQKAQIYFDPESGEFIGKLKYVDDYIDLADGAKQHFELPRTAREYKPSDFSPKFPISNVKFEVDESVKDFIHVLPRGLFFYQNEFYDAVFGDKTDYPESLKDFLFTRTGDIEDDPVDDGFGMIAAVELILLRNDWFRKYVKTLNCYWWNEETNSFDVEDGIEEAVRNWGSFHSGTYSSPTGIRKDAIPMHKLELILDEQRIIDDGLIRIDDVNNYLTKLIVETNGLRREGNFYIEENPEDGLGAITHIALCLSKQNWLRNYVKVLKCYRWNADTQDFDIEDAIQDMMLRVL